MTGRYASWASGTITPGPTDYRIEATGGFGGGFYDINPNVDVTGAIAIELVVTLNPANSPGGVLPGVAPILTMTGDSVLFDDPGGEVASNPNGLAMGFNNWNTLGVLGCDSESPCFLDEPLEVAALAAPVTTGMELAIGRACLRIKACRRCETPRARATRSSIPATRRSISRPRVPGRPPAP